MASWPPARAAFQASRERADRLAVGGIENEDGALVAGKIGRLGAVDQEAHRRRIRIVVAGRQKDRLLVGVSVGALAVRQERSIVEGPKMRVERLKPLLRADLHHDAPAALEASLQEARQRRLKRLPFQVVEEDLGHGARVTLRRS